jgi:hypothetical protein
MESDLQILKKTSPWSILRTEGILASVETFVSNLDIYLPDDSLRPIEESPALRALRGEIVTGYEHIVRIPVNGELRHRQINSSSVRDPKAI